MIKVACAIILHQNKILVTQRGPLMKMPFKWEFPGGKVEAEEDPHNCILREIQEELNLQIEIIGSLKSVFHHYPDFTIQLIPFKATIKKGTITLREHMKFVWLSPDELITLDWAAADIPIVRELLKT